MLQPMAYERGLHVRGTPLWFDAERRREMCVLTGIERRLPPVHRRVVASAPLALALEAAGYGGAILPSPWRRWLGLGGHRMQLIDAGAPPGAAAAWVQLEHERVLVTGLLRTASVQWPESEHVVARLPAIGHSGLPMGEVAVHLATELDGLLRRGKRPHVHVSVDSAEVGLVLLAELEAMGQPLSPRGFLAKVARPRPDAPGTRRPTISVGSSRIAPGEPDVPTPTLVRIDSGLGHWEPLADGPPPIKVRWFADLAALRSAVLASKAQRVSLADVPPALEPALVMALGKSIKVRFLNEAHQMVLGQQQLI